MNEQVQEALSRGGVIDITTTGRKSRAARRIEIVFHNIDGRLYISGMPSTRKRSWLANMEANPQFLLHLKRGLSADLRAVARPIKDPIERRRVLEKVAAVWRRGDIDEMVRHSPLVEVTLEGDLDSQAC